MRRLPILICIMSAMFLTMAGCSNENTFNSKNATEKASTSTQEAPYNTNKQAVKTAFSANGFTDEDVRIKINLDDKEDINSSKSKEYIYDRMLNSIDYFDTLQATYYEITSKGNAYYSTYCIQQGENTKSKEAIYNQGGKMIYYLAFDGNSTVDLKGPGEYKQVETWEDIDNLTNSSIIDEIINERNSALADSMFDSTANKKKTVTIDDENNTDYVAMVKSTSRVKTEKNKDNQTYYLRQNTPQLKTSVINYFPQEYAEGLLADFDLWDVKSQDKFLDRKCLKIKGTSKSSFSKKTGITAYEMTVDMETGALLSFTGYNKDGVVINQLKTIEYTVNQAIPSSVFDDLSKLG